MDEAAGLRILGNVSRIPGGFGCDPWVLRPKRLRWLGAIQRAHPRRKALPASRALPCAYRWSLTGSALHRAGQRPVAARLAAGGHALGQHRHQRRRQPGRGCVHVGHGRGQYLRNGSEQAERQGREVVEEGREQATDESGDATRRKAGARGGRALHRARAGLRGRRAARGAGRSRGPAARVRRSAARFLAEPAKRSGAGVGRF